MPLELPYVKRHGSFMHNFLDIPNHTDLKIRSLCVHREILSRRQFPKFADTDVSVLYWHIYFFDIVAEDPAPLSGQHEKYMGGQLKLPALPPKKFRGPP